MASKGPAARWTTLDIERLHALAATGMTGREIALAMGRTTDAVQAKARQSGITIERAAPKSAASTRSALFSS